MLLECKAKPMESSFNSVGLKLKSKLFAYVSGLLRIFLFESLAAQQKDNVHTYNEKDKVKQGKSKVKC